MSIDVSIILSLASFIISVYVLWTTQLAKFRLDVASTARVELTTNPQSLGAKQAGIKMQLLFTNKGANLGYVHDVAIAISKNGTKPKEIILLRSLFESLDETLNLTNQLPPPKLVAFSSFPVRPLETVIKNIVFVPNDSNIDFKFEMGTYTLTPYTKGLKSKEKWRKWDSLDVDINSEDIRMLGQTLVTPMVGGGQFVKWLLQSKPTNYAENALKELLSQISRKK